MNHMKIEICSLAAIILLFGSTVYAKQSWSYWGAGCEPVQRFPYAMSAVVTQIYAS